MSEPRVKRATASFQTQGRLLQELGERLVAKADVALMELIKNAFDADATECRVSVSDKQVKVEDDGHGMTEQEFLANWMSIATPQKQRKRLSHRFGRHVTGSKGIGRFAVRFLGRHLRLETVSKDSMGTGEKRRLVATFNWENIDSAAKLHTVKIPYEVHSVPPGTDTGTRLVIDALRDASGSHLGKQERTELLSIVDPFSGLETGDFDRHGDSDQDPGFKVTLVDSEGGGSEQLVDAVLANAYARLTIKHDGDSVEFCIRHKDGRTLLEKTLEYRTSISRGFFADIRYCPRRAGMFRGTEVDGRTVWSWLRENGGIGIVDRGFRIRPFGFPDDDWLGLGLDAGRRRRTWRVDFMNDHFPMAPEASSQAKLNPMLYLPNFHQLVGAVFVESSQDLDSGLPSDLTPSMDREGFVHNDAFSELTELVRAGLEMLAFADHNEQRCLEEKKREKAAQELRSDLGEAVDYIKTVAGLSIPDRDALVTRFTTLSKELDDVEEYQQVAASKMELMGLLGVMAGFVTHEMQRLLNGLERLLPGLRRFSDADPEVGSLVTDIETTYAAIVGQLDYSAAFIGSVHEVGENPEPINARGAAKLVVGQFRQFRKDRGIKADVEIDEDVATPPLPHALYVGVIMNLFTNALKAAVGGTDADPNPRVVIKAWNEPKHHVLEIADTGIGIPPTLEKRIWDPLFTTTSGQEYNPLGSGMGLGLTLIRRVVTDAKGKIGLVDPPPGFTTCFRVWFPRQGERR